ncbi:capsular biosynthesis protein [Cycloclasticus sp. 46_120_T64]|nr:capsular biosynthesis protein [Cycloclasticus sp. 46_120_T64]
MLNVVRMSVLLSLLLPSLLQAADKPLREYLLGPGDLLSIHVFEEEELSLELRLSDRGTIAYPFLGEIETQGLGLAELSGLIKRGLADGYLVNPIVSITIVEYRQFYINGEVEKPGGYAYLPGLTVQKAVALAGGFTERASKEKITVVHDGAEASTPRQLGLSSAVRPGDVVTIEESFF